jgi:hypothetical protein
MDSIEFTDDNSASDPVGYHLAGTNEDAEMIVEHATGVMAFTAVPVSQTIITPDGATRETGIVLYIEDHEHHSCTMFTLQQFREFVAGLQWHLASLEDHPSVYDTTCPWGNLPDARGDNG